MPVDKTTLRTRDLRDVTPTNVLHCLDFDDTIVNGHMHYEIAMTELSDEQFIAPTYTNAYIANLRAMYALYISNPTWLANQYLDTYYFIQDKLTLGFFDKLETVSASRLSTMRPIDVFLDLQGGFKNEEILICYLKAALRKGDTVSITTKSSYPLAVKAALKKLRYYGELDGETVTMQAFDPRVIDERIIIKADLNINETRPERLYKRPQIIAAHAEAARRIWGFRDGGTPRRLTRIVFMDDDPKNVEEKHLPTISLPGAHIPSVRTIHAVLVPKTHDPEPDYIRTMVEKAGIEDTSELEAAYANRETRLAEKARAEQARLTINLTTYWQRIPESHRTEENRTDFIARIIDQLATNGLRTHQAEDSTFALVFNKSTYDYVSRSDIQFAKHIISEEASAFRASLDVAPEASARQSLTADYLRRLSGMPCEGEERVEHNLSTLQTLTRSQSPHSSLSSSTERPDSPEYMAGTQESFFAMLVNSSDSQKGKDTSAEDFFASLALSNGDHSGAKTEEGKEAAPSCSPSDAFTSSLRESLATPHFTESRRSSSPINKRDARETMVESILNAGHAALEALAVSGTNQTTTPLSLKIENKADVVLHCFDFDDTIINGHLHIEAAILDLSDEEFTDTRSTRNYLEALNNFLASYHDMPNSLSRNLKNNAEEKIRLGLEDKLKALTEEEISTKIPLDLFLELQGGFKNEAILISYIKTALKAGDKVAITTKSQYPHSVKEALKRLKYHDGTLAFDPAIIDEHIIVVANFGWRNKATHILTAKREAEEALTETQTISRVVFSDDNPSNVLRENLPTEDALGCPITSFGVPGQHDADPKTYLIPSAEAAGLDMTDITAAREVQRMIVEEKHAAKTNRLILNLTSEWERIPADFRSDETKALYVKTIQAMLQSENIPTIHSRGLTLTIDGSRNLYVYQSWIDMANTLINDQTTIFINQLDKRHGKEPIDSLPEVSARSYVSRMLQDTGKGKENDQILHELIRTRTTSSSHEGIGKTITDSHSDDELAMESFFDCLVRSVEVSSQHIIEASDDKGKGKAASGLSKLMRAEFATNLIESRRPETSASRRRASNKGDVSKAWMLTRSIREAALRDEQILDQIFSSSDEAVREVENSQAAFLTSTNGVYVGNSLQGVRDALSRFNPETTGDLTSQLTALETMMSRLPGSSSQGAPTLHPDATEDAITVDDFTSSDADGETTGIREDVGSATPAIPPKPASHARSTVSGRLSDPVASTGEISERPRGSATPETIEPGLPDSHHIADSPSTATTSRYGTHRIPAEPCRRTHIYSTGYKKSHAGKPAIYTTLFAGTRARTKGLFFFAGNKENKRYPFANTRSDGKWCANLSAWWNGERPAFSNTRAWAGTRKWFVGYVIPTFGLIKSKEDNSAYRFLKRANSHNKLCREAEHGAVQNEDVTPTVSR